MIAALRRLFARPKICICGHVRDAHMHYRAGTDCSQCACPRYRRAHS